MAFMVASERNTSTSENEKRAFGKKSGLAWPRIIGEIKKQTQEDEKEKRILALCYFPKGLLLKYLRRNNVSQSCSEWNDVVPLCYKYQN